MKTTLTIFAILTLVTVPLAYSQSFTVVGTADGNAKDNSNRSSSNSALNSLTANDLDAGDLPRSRPKSSGTKGDLGICFVSVMDDVEIPARTRGTLMQLGVRKGDQVQAQALIGSIDSTDAIVQREFALKKKSVADYQAASMVQLEMARESYDYNRERLVAKQRGFDKGVVTSDELQETRWAARQAQYSITAAQEEHEVALQTATVESISVKMAEQNLQKHSITSPVAGDVSEVYKSVGEYVEEGERVARVVRMDKLQVQGSFSALEFNPSEMMGRQVKVTMNIARGEIAEFTGHIYSVSLEQTANQRYRVWAEVENRLENGQWVLRPQAEVTMQADMTR